MVVNQRTSDLLLVRSIRHSSAASPRRQCMAATVPRLGSLGFRLIPAEHTVPSKLYLGEPLLSAEGSFVCARCDDPTDRWGSPSLLSQRRLRSAPHSGGSATVAHHQCRRRAGPIGSLTGRSHLKHLSSEVARMLLTGKRGTHHLSTPVTMRLLLTWLTTSSALIGCTPIMT